jgi:predicted transcriptional regulator
MKTVTLGVSSWEDTMSRAKSAFRGEHQGHYLSFATVDLLWEVLNPRRLDILNTMKGKGPMTLRGVAKLTGKDVKTTHGDVHVLLRNRILEKDSSGKIVFPYDAIHVDFMLTAEAA